MQALGMELSSSPSESPLLRTRTHTWVWTNEDSPILRLRAHARVWTNGE